MPRLMKIKEEHKSFLTWNQEEQFLEMGKAIPWFQLWEIVADLVEMECGIEGGLLT